VEGRGKGEDGKGESGIKGKGKRRGGTNWKKGEGNEDEVPN